jgi:hypothetical protein
MLKRIAFLLAVVVAPLGAQTFQPGRLPATGRDSFDVIYQGRPVGAVIMSFAKTGENITLVTDARITQMGVTDLDTLVFNATTLAPVLATSNQSMGPMNLAGRVTIAGGKATGTTQQPGPGGAQTMPVDATVPTGSILDGTDALLITTIDFSHGLSITYKTFDGKSGKSKDYTLKVVGKESVTVPAGTYEAWKTEVTSDETAQIWISTAEPRKILMLRLDGQQLEMKRASR